MTESELVALYEEHLAKAVDHLPADNGAGGDYRWAQTHAAIATAAAARLADVTG